MGFPLSWAIKPGVLDSIFSAETHYPVALASLIEPQFLDELVRHGRLVMAPYMHPSHLGSFTWRRFIGRTPKADKSWNFVNEKCPRR